METYALVTGSAQRIGKAVAIHLAKNDYNLVLHYNSSKDKAQKLKEEIESIYNDIKVELLQINFLGNNDFDHIFEELKKKKITIEVLVNCASDFIPSDFKEEGSELLDKEMSINFNNPVYFANDNIDFSLGGLDNGSSFGNFFVVYEDGVRLSNLDFSFL